MLDARCSKCNKMVVDHEDNRGTYEHPLCHWCAGPKSNWRSHPDSDGLWWCIDPYGDSETILVRYQKGLKLLTYVGERDCGMQEIHGDRRWQKAVVPTYP